MLKSQISLKRALKKFGLTDPEIKIYLACLKHESVSPFQLSKITNITRTTVYDILMEL